jgi:hypothetical protein
MSGDSECGHELAVVADTLGLLRLDDAVAEDLLNPRTARTNPNTPSAATPLVNCKRIVAMTRAQSSAAISALLATPAEAIRDPRQRQSTFLAVPRCPRGVFCAFPPPSVSYRR